MGAPPSQPPQLEARGTPQAGVEPTSDGWRFSIPSGPAGAYRWAQLDDYMARPRRAFLWRPPAGLELQARVSAPDLPGTWGFGFWNDPFNLSLGVGGTARRLPALPNTAWFFYASPQNYLSLRDDLPAQGLLATTFRSPKIPSGLLAPGLAALPLLAWPPGARWLRRLARRLIKQDAARLEIDPGEWHTYRLDWQSQRVVFSVDGKPAFSTSASPHGPLGLVLWIDNQYAAFTPQGRLAQGSLENPAAAWLEVRNLRV